MTFLSALACPQCAKEIPGLHVVGSPPTAARFEHCLRRCEPCGVGVSNASAVAEVTYIYRDPLENIPPESRQGAREALMNALNVRNRESKWLKFGFSTSEDSVTWVVFTHLLRSGKLLATLQGAGLVPLRAVNVTPTVLLWGSPIDDESRGAEIRNRLTAACAAVGEDANSLSEPDVIIDLAEAGLIFIEVKYQSGNDHKAADYPGWSRYLGTRGIWNADEVRNSGCYELARNWCLLRTLAGNRPATLVNLGPASLFARAEGARLNRFKEALFTDARFQFRQLAWPVLLRSTNASGWFGTFCQRRSLLERS